MQLPTSLDYSLGSGKDDLIQYWSFGSASLYEAEIGCLKDQEIHRLGIS